MAVCTDPVNGDDGLCSSCKKIEDIDTQIVEVKKHLASLRAERVALKTARNATHDHLVARLPLELVSQIFQIYVDVEFGEADGGFCDDLGNVSPFLVHWMVDAPLRLGAVCHTWRTIAWTSPRLWIKMCVNILQSRASNTIPELATQWLERTGQLPLTVCLYEDFHNSGADTSREVAISLMRTLCKISSRWRNLSISLRFDQDIYDDKTEQFWTPDIERDFNLQHLQLKNLSPSFAAQLFKNAHRKPSPAYVHLYNTQIGCLDIDWSNATTIDVNPSTFQEVIRLSQASIRLQTLDLGLISFHDPDSMQSLSSLIMIPTLRSLYFHYSSTSIILDYLTLPSLEELHSISEHGTVNSLFSLVRRSHCQLKTLDIWISEITDDLFIFLQATPSLKALSIRDHLGDGNSQRLFKHLATSNGPDDFPNLETLRFRINPSCIISWETIPNIFDPGQTYIGASRRSLDLRLEITGEIDKIGYIDMISLRRISALLKQGIIISILFQEQSSNDGPEDFIATSTDFHCPNKESSADNECS